MGNVDNPQEIIVILGWYDLERVKAFANSVSLQTAMEEMGEGRPHLKFHNQFPPPL